MPGFARFLDFGIRIAAFFGGGLMLVASLLVTASVLGRWAFGAPIEGDFEFVKMMTAVAVFCFLPITQWSRGNIMVDTFTTRLPPRFNAALDAVWDFAYCVFVCGLTIAMVVGTTEAYRSGETTMMRAVPTWPSIGISALLCILLAMTALSCGMRFLQRRSAGEARE